MHKARGRFYSISVLHGGRAEAWIETQAENEQNAYTGHPIGVHGVPTSRCNPLHYEDGTGFLPDQGVHFSTRSFFSAGTLIPSDSLVTLFAYRFLSSMSTASTTR